MRIKLLRPGVKPDWGSRLGAAGSQTSPLAWYETVVSKRAELCVATPDYPHPASRRSHRCDAHQAEFENAMNVYNARLHKFRKGGGKNPGDRETFQSAISYTRPTEIITIVDARDRNYIVNAVSADNRAVEKLEQLARTGSSFEGITPDAIRTMLRDYLLVRERTIDLLASFGDEPK